MADDDVLEQARAAGLTIATGVSRLGDTFIRAAQQRAEADLRDKQAQVEDARSRYEAQARVAEELYRRAADPDWMRSVGQAEALSVWEAAQLWADLDQERFHTAADQVAVAYQHAYRQAYETDPAAAVEELRGHQRSPDEIRYDSPEARSQRADGLVDAGWPVAAVHARVVSDKLNAVDPVTTRSRRSEVSSQVGRGHSSRPVKQRTQGHER